MHARQKEGAPETRSVSMAESKEGCVAGEEAISEEPTIQGRQYQILSSLGAWPELGGYFKWDGESGSDMTGSCLKGMILATVLGGDYEISRTKGEKKTGRLCVL